MRMGNYCQHCLRRKARLMDMETLRAYCRVCAPTEGELKSMDDKDALAEEIRERYGETVANIAEKSFSVRLLTHHAKFIHDVMKSEKLDAAAHVIRMILDDAMDKEIPTPERLYNMLMATEYGKDLFRSEVQKAALKLKAKEFYKGVEPEAIQETKAEAEDEDEGDEIIIG